MRIDGQNNAAICSALKITDASLIRWWSDELMQDYLNTLAQNVEEAFAIQLATAGMKSVATLVAILDKPATDQTVSDHLKLEVARDLMDRLPGTARVRERHDPSADIPQLLQVFMNMPDAQLLEFINSGGKPPAIEQ